jgi:hypothetical protein
MEQGNISYPVEVLLYKICALLSRLDKHGTSGIITAKLDLQQFKHYAKKI